MRVPCSGDAGPEPATLTSATRQAGPGHQRPRAHSPVGQGVGRKRRDAKPGNLGGWLAVEMGRLHRSGPFINEWCSGTSSDARGSAAATR